MPEAGGRTTPTSQPKIVVVYIAHLEILPYDLHYSEVMSFTKFIKDVDK